MYKYLFGPVPSRRLGISLGIDLVPKKVCSLDCVYCEVGKTTLLTTKRKEYIKYDKVIAELNNFMSKNKDIDFITFSGSGEPSLNTHFGKILNYVKQTYPNIKLAVLTNGTLLQNPEIRKEMLNADVVLPSLDAASQEVFNKINRPEKNIKINDYINGIIDFKQEFKGQIWLEILILPGYNDSKQELDLLKQAIIKINPDSVQLNTLDRPGVIDNLIPASHNDLQNIINYWGLKNVTIIASAPERTKIKSYRDDIETTILETIKRRPCTLNDLHKILGTHISEINKYLSVLENSGQITKQEQQRGIFYKIAN